ncbi:anhydro-N-acetylmuramic acid kinase [Neisseriaceae bacterium B1]
MTVSSQFFIGIMSGTSMDGVDAVVVRMDDGAWGAAVGHFFVPYSADLRARLLALQQVQHNELHLAYTLGQELARLYAEAVSGVLAATGLAAQGIVAVGCHGQTVRHAPEAGYSVQLVDLALLAQLTGILTVGDFRSGDLAAGGQGAPLVPAFHQAVFADKNSTRVVLNIGGIANISVLSPDELPFGFDTGAGNMLLDAWMTHIWEKPFDANGEMAAQGRVLPDLLRDLCAHEYFRQPFPKSTGRELFSLAWLQSHLQGDENPHDVMRTLVAFSAETMVLGIDAAAQNVAAVFVCGGGVQHPLLVDGLREVFEPRGVEVLTTDALQLDPQQVEAAAFAWLAFCWVNRVPSNPTRATGARRNVVLGAGYWG